jgi:methionyl-tRNA formyltransferase
MRHPQDHAKATLAPILKKEDGQINFQRTAAEILNRLRGFQPWPGAFTSFRGKTLNVWAATLAQEKVPQGEIVIAGNRFLAGCGTNTTLEFMTIQPEGKKRMSAADYIHGYHPASGEKIG